MAVAEEESPALGAPAGPRSFSSGIPRLDALFPGGAGIVGGQLAALFGPEQCGKTALALWFARTLLHDPEPVAGWVVCEPEPIGPQLAWAGIDPAHLIINYQTPSLPGLEAARLMVEEGCDLVVIDSLTNLCGHERGERLQSVLGHGLGALARRARERGALVLLTDQVRCRTGQRLVVPAAAGPAFLRNVDVQLSLRAGEGIYQAGEAVGRRIDATLVRTAGPSGGWGRQARLSLRWEQGFSQR